MPALYLGKNHLNYSDVAPNGNWHRKTIAADNKNGTSESLKVPLNLLKSPDKGLADKFNRKNGAVDAHDVGVSFIFYVIPVALAGALWDSTKPAALYPT